MKRNITILGAGLVGSLLSIILSKRGYSVEVYERRSDMRKNPQSAGRSINLAMSERGWKALDLAGLRTDIEDIAIPMKGRFLHQKDGSTAFQQYGKNGEAIYSVSRGILNMRLMDLAEKHGVTIHFDRKCTHVDIDKNIAIFTDSEDKEYTIESALVIGADGAFSALRKSYTSRDRVDYQQFYISHGYKELMIPPGENGTFLLEKNALHIWPRGEFMMIALPNPDGNFTCTLFFPFEGKVSFDSINTDEDVQKLFAEYFSDAVPLMPTLIEDYRNNPTSSLITVKVHPWIYKNKSFLIGDAAHAIVPFYGQGMNAGFEDCTVLDELLNLYQDNWDKILPEYQRRRKPNGDAVADLALENFIEMRDKVAHQEFLERKKIEKDLGLRYPSIFNSVYEMVSFSHTPYAFALSSSNAQDRLLQKIMKEGDYFSLINETDFQNKLETWMKEYQQEIMEIPDYN